MQGMNKRDSIYFQLLRLLLIASFAAMVVFLAVNYTIGYVIDHIYYNSEYEEERNESYVEELRQYVEEEELSTRDTRELKNWVQEQKIISLSVYKDNIQVFDSVYPEQELWEESIIANYYSWETYYPVRFSDGEAKVSISGLYAYQFHNYAFIAELLLSFILFLFLVLMGIRRKMDFILRLRDEIDILEGGSLDYKITVKGRDELSALAEGIENMRVSFKSLIREEAEMVQENQRIVTEMSHDLRTPVTSIMLYTEILKMGKYESREQMREYLEKIEQKALCMKHLTDHLFEYSLLTGEGEIQLEEPESFKILFYDLLSEMASYLEQKGFFVSLQMEWPDTKVRVSTDYLLRIMDNITSNILKYADDSAPIIISSAGGEQWTGIMFENRIHEPDHKTESTGIGIRNIQNMMAKMEGTCTVLQEEKKFRVMLLFPERNRS